MVETYNKATYGRELFGNMSTMIYVGTEAMKHENDGFEFAMRRRAISVELNGLALLNDSKIDEVLFRKSDGTGIGLAKLLTLRLRGKVIPRWPFRCGRAEFLSYALPLTFKIDT